MERCEKRAFQLVKMRKKEHLLDHKNQVRNWLYLESRVLEYKWLYLILGFVHMKVKGLPKLQ